VSAVYEAHSNALYEIERLKKQLETVNDLFQRSQKHALENAAKVEIAKTALQIYGRHFERCQIYHSGGKCDCLFSQAVSKLSNS
jgi:hypothetical protein